MYNEELHWNTKELYHFMVRVIAYFFINFAKKIAYVFQHISQRWKLFFIAIVWAILHDLSCIVSIWS